MDPETVLKGETKVDLLIITINVQTMNLSEKAGRLEAKTKRGRQNSPTLRQKDPEAQARREVRTTSGSKDSQKLDLITVRLQHVDHCK